MFASIVDYFRESTHGNGGGVLYHNIMCVSGSISADIISLKIITAASIYSVPNQHGTAVSLCIRPQQQIFTRQINYVEWCPY